MITILDALPYEKQGTRIEPLLAKTFAKSGDEIECQSYTGGYIFNVLSEDINDLADLAEVILAIEPISTACVIRGELIDPTNTSAVRRTLSDDQPVFRDAAISWVMLDLDDVDGTGLETAQERLERIESLLPPDFQGVSYFYQWSGSAAVYGWDKLKIHLWFWLEEPTTSAFLREKADLEGWSVDKAVFNPVQVHYTAKPIFENMADPLGDERSGFRLHGRNQVSLSPIVKPAPAYRPKPTYTANGEGRMARLNERLDEITGIELHASVIRAAMSYAAMWGHERDFNEIYDLLHERISQCGRNQQRVRDEIRDLKKIINSAFRKA